MFGFGGREPIPVMDLSFARISVFLSLSLTLGASAKVDFVHEVLPILRDNCVKCHSNGKYKGGLSLETREALLDSETVEVGKANESLFIEVLTAEDEDERMPHDADPLPASQIAILTAWVNEGLAWEKGFTFKKKTWKAPLAHRRVSLPPALEKGENPIDRMTRVYFEKNKVQPPEPISDARFLRRASLDLLGLLPSLQELEAFATSRDPNKRTDKIEELLSRDIDYADHWMTFWNDLLRNDYAGTGFIDGGRSQITGWLYDSLKSNKPYDQFVRELLNPTKQSEGFIKGIKWRGNVNASQVQEIQFAQNVSQVFFGENMKCASCHDSFIDDWKLEDAYGMAAIIAGKPLEMYRCDKPTGEKMNARFLFAELGEIDPNAPRDKRLQRAAELATAPGNGRLARTIVNRLWARLMGRGLVEPVDMMGNRPWSEDILDYLAHDLATHQYDLKRTLALIVGSKTYQSATVAPSKASDDYVFEGPVAKRMTAEQFIDAVWGITETAPSRIDAKVDRTAGKKVEGKSQGVVGEWIWTATNARPAGEKVTFVREVKLPPQATGRIVITCDNEYVLMVNGREVGRDSNWEDVEAYDLSKVLKAGRNVFEVQARNLGSGPNAAALFAQLEFIDQEGRKVVVSTDSKWKANGKTAVSHRNKLWESRVKPQILEHLNQKPGRVRQVRASLVKSTLLMRALGRPNREQVVTTRPAELTTLQALELNNGDEFTSYLNRGAARLAKVDDLAVEHLYLQTLSRRPTSAEMAVAKEIIGEKMTTERAADLLWTILMLPDFQYIN
ncbi:MAG: DUF1549 domain-containing protein [Akkermansiaceae bacterium]|jgi:hypothetical protein